MALAGLVPGVAGVAAWTKTVKASRLIHADERIRIFTDLPVRAARVDSSSEPDERATGKMADFKWKGWGDYFCSLSVSIFSG